MITLLFALSLQAPQQAPHRATVGDTIWIVRRLLLPARHGIRAAAWEMTGDVELLGPARVISGAGSAEIAYPLVAWTPGAHTLHVPGPLLLAADGSIDSLPASDTTITVASVLPPGAADTALRPQPRAGLVHRTTVTWMPVLILTALAALLLSPLHWWWRRRGRRNPEKVATRQASSPPLERWAGAGEARTVLAAGAARVRHAIAVRVPDLHEGLDTPTLVSTLEGRPGWPLAEIEDVLGSLDSARFALAPPADVLALYERAIALAARIEAPVVTA